MTIRVLIVDDQSVIRAGLRAILEFDPSITVVGEAPHGREGVRLAASLIPEVVLMDIRMPVLDGIQATQELTQDPRFERTRVLMLTTFDSEDLIVDSLAAGASGFIVKDCEPDDLRQAVRAVADGTMALTPAVTERLVAACVRRADLAARREARQRLSVLTQREVEVLRAIGNGLTNDEIAAQLYLSAATARTYVGRLLVKLGCRDRVALVVLAHRAELSS